MTSPLAGVFPGSFDPLTVAHLVIADAVRDQVGLDRLDLVISHLPLAKQARDQAPVDHRLAAIDRHGRPRPWLSARSTESRLLADIASGYDVVVLGADKWVQIQDPVFYGGSVVARDEALDRLPRVALIPRAGASLPASVDHLLIDVDPAIGDISSSAVRAGRHDWRA